MVHLNNWPARAALVGPRLQLEPLRVEHAEEMAPLLDDAGLYMFIGGQPATAEELRDKYRRQVVGRSAEVLECQRITGEDCYILKIAAPPWPT